MQIFLITMHSLAQVVCFVCLSLANDAVVIRSFREQHLQTALDVSGFLKFLKSYFAFSVAKFYSRKYSPITFLDYYRNF